MGCIVPVWLHLFSAKFIWCLQRCVHLADPVWYCIIEEFLILTMAQTVVNNSFTTVLRQLLLQRLFCTSFSLFSLFLTFSTAITWCLATCSENCWLESLYGGPSCHFNDTGTKSNYRFLCRIPFSSGFLTPCLNSKSDPTPSAFPSWSDVFPSLRLNILQVEACFRKKKNSGRK